MRYLLSAMCVVLTTLSYAQNTVGLLSYNPDLSYDGYNLIYPHNQPHVYLLNNCGEIVHVWEDEDNYRPGNTAYLLPNGNLLKTKRDAVVNDDVIWAGGGGETIELRSWDNDLLASYTLNDDQYRLHHDIAPLPDGNVLAVCWERMDRAASIAAGRDTTLLPDDEVWSEIILEIDVEADSIVWQWRVWDHLIQDYDPEQSNFGDVSSAPRKIDINYSENAGEADWLHINSIDYEPARGHILLSVPEFNEVWIIDHNTTTATASGPAGDLLYRWGNPQTYSDAPPDRQRLYYQHDAHFIDDHLTGAVPFFGLIGIYNNRVGTDFSTAEIINPDWDMYAEAYGYNADDDQPYAPQSATTTITHPDPELLYSTGLSSLQVLPNRNFLLTAGRTGYSVELSPDNEIVWEYKTPLRAGDPVFQGDSLVTGNNLTFRMDRYPVDYPAFANRDLTPKGWIELAPDEDFCAQLLSVDPTIALEMNLQIAPNPTASSIEISWDGMSTATIEIYNQVGQMMDSMKSVSGARCYLDVSSWPADTYFVSVNGRVAATFVKI